MKSDRVDRSLPIRSSSAHAWYLRAIYRKGRETLPIRRHFNTCKNSTPASPACRVSLSSGSMLQSLEGCPVFPQPCLILGKESDEGEEEGTAPSCLSMSVSIGKSNHPSATSISRISVNESILLGMNWNYTDRELGHPRRTF